VRYGINSLNFSDTFLEGDLGLFDKCRALGFDVLEITPVDPDRFPARKVREAARDAGMAVNMNFALRAESNPLSPDPAVRRRAVELSKQVVDLCMEAGAEIYCGANYCAWKYFTGKPRTCDEWQWGVECYREVCDYAAKGSSLVVAVETLNRFESYFLNTAADAVRFVQDVGLANAQVHLDTFHMIREEDDMGAAIRACGDRLGYVHACGSQRGIPGRDLVPWRTALEAVRDAGYHDCITIESFHPDKSIAPLVGIWRRFADSQEQLATEGLAFLRQMVSEIDGLDNES
jgi:D-psicose/D-tagatose/L-ribulose 3-epimerase